MMINFATLVGRGATFTPTDSASAAPSGLPEGSEFAALVKAASSEAVDFTVAAVIADAGVLATDGDNALPTGAIATAAADDLGHAESELISLVTGQGASLPPAIPNPQAATASAPSIPVAGHLAMPSNGEATTAKVGALEEPAAGTITDMALPSIATDAQGTTDEALQDLSAEEQQALQGLPQHAVQRDSASPVPPGLATGAPVAPAAILSNFRSATIGVRSAPAAPLVTDSTSDSDVGGPRSAGSRANAAAMLFGGARDGQLSIELPHTNADTEAFPEGSMTDGKGAALRAGLTGEAPVAQRAVVEPAIALMQDQAAPMVRGVAAVQAASTAQALGSEVIDMGVSGQWIDRLAREIAGIADGSGHSRFTLNPPHLGRLQVDLVKASEMFDVRLIAETDEAAQRLNEGRNALQADPRMASINLGLITVEKASQSSESGGRDQGQAQREQAGQMQQQQQDNRQAAARSSQQERDMWNARTGEGRSTQIESDDTATRAARRARADGHVRFA